SSRFQRGCENSLKAELSTGHTLLPTAIRRFLCNLRIGRWKEMRNKPISSARFTAVLLVAMSLLLIHTPAPLIAGAFAAQDPNATLPPPKPKPAPKKSTPPA